LAQKAGVTKIEVEDSKIGAGKRDQYQVSGLRLFLEP
jgi:hypothetical protein